MGIPYLKMLSKLIYSSRIIEKGFLIKLVKIEVLDALLIKAFKLKIYWVAVTFVQYKIQVLIYRANLQLNSTIFDIYFYFFTNKKIKLQDGRMWAGIFWMFLGGTIIVILGLLLFLLLSLKPSIFYVSPKYKHKIL